MNIFPEHDDDIEDIVLKAWCVAAIISFAVWLVHWWITGGSLS